MKSKTILILGATSSIAKAIAARFAEEGTTVLLGGRNIDEVKKTTTDIHIRYPAEVHPLKFDATDFASHEDFFTRCLELAGGELNGVVLCHGFMAEQKDAEVQFDLANRMIATNYASAVSILNRCANHFEENKSGFVCAISSVAGDRGRQSNYIYGSTKAALNTYLDGMRVRLAKAGVPVITVKPGFVDTKMTWGLPGMFLIARPEDVGSDVFRAIQKGKDVVYTPWFWWGIMSIICNIPHVLFKRMKM